LNPGICFQSIIAHLLPVKRPFIVAGVVLIPFALIVFYLVSEPVSAMGVYDWYIWQNAERDVLARYMILQIIQAASAVSFAVGAILTAYGIIAKPVINQKQ
jgi:uncharacterized membrane protein YjgN (DUF898 family)